MDGSVDFSVSKKTSRLKVLRRDSRDWRSGELAASRRLAELTPH